jgi:DnaJ-class molecular chaperone
VDGKQGRGDLFAELQIELPKELSDEDQAAIRGIDERNPLSPRAGLNW